MAPIGATRHPPVKPYQLRHCYVPCYCCLHMFWDTVTWRNFSFWAPQPPGKTEPYLAQFSTDLSDSSCPKKPQNGAIFGYHKLAAKIHIKNELETSFLALFWHMFELWRPRKKSLAHQMCLKMLPQFFSLKYSQFQHGACFYLSFIEFTLLKQVCNQHILCFFNKRKYFLESNGLKNKLYLTSICYKCFGSRASKRTLSVFIRIPKRELSLNCQ